MQHWSFVRASARKTAEENVARAVMATLKSFCTRRLGRRDQGGVVGPEDALDERLFQRLKDRPEVQRCRVIQE